MFRPPHRATNAAPQSQRPITHLELFTGDDGSFGDGDAFVELLGGQLGALVLDGFCTPLKSAASAELPSAGKSAVARQISAFARSTAAARVRMYADADAELQHELQRAYRSQQLFTASEAMRGSPWCQLNVGAKRDDMLTLGGQPFFPLTVDASSFDLRLLKCDGDLGWFLKHPRCGEGRGTRLLPRETREIPTAAGFVVQRQVEPLLTDGVAWTYRLHVKFSALGRRTRFAVVRQPLLRMAAGRFRPGAEEAHRYISNSGVADLAGVKYRCTTWPWSARSVGELVSPHRGLSEAAVLAESVDIIQRTFELGAARSQFLRQPACALVYGFDFVLDARGRPMLLEVQTNPSTNNKEEFECFNQTAAFDALMRASLAFDAHEESAELIYLKADAIEAMRQEARVNRGRMRRPDRQPPTADWPSGCRNFSRDRNWRPRPRVLSARRLVFFQLN